jgi:hypothetical protein
VARSGVRESWAIAVHDALASCPDVLMAQVVPGESKHELVLTFRTSPPDAVVVEDIWVRIGPLLCRDDSPLDWEEREGSRSGSWRRYPAVDERERHLFAVLDWKHAVVVHEWVD